MKRFLGLALASAVCATVSAQEGRELPVSKIPNLGEAAELYFSPDSQWLIGTVKREGDAHHQVYVAKTDGSVIRRINDKGEDACSFFFPDGKRILWTSTRDRLDLPKGEWSNPANYPKGSELYSSDLEGKNIQRLTTNEVYDAEAAVSPDGRWILFGRDVDGKMDLWVMKSDGTGEKQLTFTEEWQEGGAQFLPDSNTILTRAWKRKDQGGRITPMEIFTVQRDSGEIKQITNAPGKTHWAPFPAPDGDHFAYVKVDMPEGGGRPNWEIVLRSLKTGQERQLTFHPGFDGFPAFSPDGKWMTFSSSREAAPGARTLHQYLMDVSSLGLGPKKK